ncbi:MAG: hypothetical protein WCQ96_04455 [Patescibacteria group bacterium]
MTKQKTVAIAIISLLVLSNACFAVKLNQTQKELATIKSNEEKTINIKQPIIEFNQLFVDKVLRAEGEISFDTRLELENKVRELKDAEVLEKWNGFVNAATETDAQKSVKALLGLLAQRMNG